MVKIHLDVSKKALDKFEAFCRENNTNIYDVIRDFIDDCHYRDKDYRNLTEIGVKKRDMRSFLYRWKLNNL